MRLPALIFTFLLTLATPPSHAGDTAELNILGFTGDGSVFAFEEFGVQDGSGFPYANRFYIDTSTDRFLPGTPIRIRIDDESATVERARAEAMEKGGAIVAEADLERNRGFTAALNPVTELSADPHRLVVNPRPVFPPVDPAMEFRLEEIALPGPDFCADMGQTVGFRLTLADASSGGATKVLHEDKSIPRSRNCVTGYSLGGVQTFALDHAPTAYAVLIAVRSVGFEGPDFRWLAVAKRF